jgi:hypothetical protein
METLFLIGRQYVWFKVNSGQLCRKIEAISYNQAIEQFLLLWKEGYLGNCIECTPSIGESRWFNTLEELIRMNIAYKCKDSNCGWKIVSVED